MIMLQDKHLPYIFPFDKLINVRNETYEYYLKKGTNYLIEQEKQYLGNVLIVTNTKYENFYSLQGFHCITKYKNGFYAGYSANKWCAGIPLFLEIKILFRKMFGIKNKIEWSVK